MFKFRTLRAQSGACELSALRLWRPLMNLSLSVQRKKSPASSHSHLCHMSIRDKRQDRSKTATNYHATKRGLEEWERRNKNPTAIYLRRLLRTLLCLRNRNKNSLVIAASDSNINACYLLHSQKHSPNMSAMVIIRSLFPTAEGLETRFL